MSKTKTKTEKPLTTKQFERMVKDRAEELLELVLQHVHSVEELPDGLYQDFAQFVRENYCADKGVKDPAEERAA